VAETQQQDPLRQIAQSIVNEHQGINDTVKNKMMDDLVATMERFINTELLARLDNAQAQEFLDLLNTNPTDEQTVQFFKDKNVNVDEAVMVALQSFKDSYVG
jgi:hypothetical protein